MVALASMVRVAHLGQRVSSQDEIIVDGGVVETVAANAPQVLVLNKAGGLVCSRRDPEGRGTIFRSAASPAWQPLGNGRAAGYQYHRFVTGDQ